MNISLQPDHQPTETAAAPCVMRVELDDDTIAKLAQLTAAMRMPDDSATIVALMMLDAIRRGAFRG